MNLFDEYFEEKGISYSIINPNESFFERIIQRKVILLNMMQLNLRSNL